MVTGVGWSRGCFDGDVDVMSRGCGGDDGFRRGGFELRVLYGVPEADQGGEVHFQAESFRRGGGDASAELGHGIGLEPIEECESLFIGEFGGKGMGVKLALQNGWRKKMRARAIRS